MILNYFSIYELLFVIVVGDILKIPFILLRFNLSSGIEIAKPFITATSKVLETMANVTPVPKTPYVKKGLVAEGDISAVIGITGHYTGSISVSFSRPCAIALVKAMLGDDIQDVLQDTRDAVGEITNMISGQARAGLAEMGIILQGSTPTVIVGDFHTITHSPGVAVVAIPFITKHGDFTLEFCLE